jgi:hypothetical protein
MSLNDLPSNFNSDVEEYIYDHAIVDDDTLIDLPELLEQTRRDFGNWHHLPTDNLDHRFASAVWLRASQHNAAQVEINAAEADMPVAIEYDEGTEAIEVPTTNWTLPRWTNVIAALTGLLVTLSPVLFVAIVG